MREPENLICPVMGNEVDPDLFVDYEGRRIGFCCPPCVEKFKADPEKYLEKVDAELAARKGGK
jgi:YHS domain-containing protein